MRFTMLVAAMMVTAVSFAESSGRTQFPGTIVQQGNLVDLKIVPGDKEISVFLVGDKVANMKINDVGLEAQVQVGKELQSLTVTRKEGHFVIKNGTTSRALKLKLKSNDLSEQFDVHLK